MKRSILQRILWFWIVLSCLSGCRPPAEESSPAVTEPIEKVKAKAKEKEKEKKPPTALETALLEKARLEAKRLPLQREIQAKLHNRTPEEKAKLEQGKLERGKLVGTSLGVVTLSAGKKFENVKVRSISNVGVQISHKDGFALLKFPEMTEEDQKRFYFDAGNYELTKRAFDLQRAEAAIALKVKRLSLAEQQVEANREQAKANAKMRAEKKATAKKSGPPRGTVLGFERVNGRGGTTLEVVVVGPDGAAVSVSKVPIRYESRIKIGRMFPAKIMVAPGSGEVSESGRPKPLKYMLAPSRGL